MNNKAQSGPLTITVPSSRGRSADVLELLAPLTLAYVRRAEPGQAPVTPEPVTCESGEREQTFIPCRVAGFVTIDSERRVVWPMICDGDRRTGVELRPLYGAIEVHLDVRPGTHSCTPDQRGRLRLPRGVLQASGLERIATTLMESPVPLLREFAGEARRLLSGRTLDTYRHHIDRLVRDLGDRRLDGISLLDLERLAIEVRQDAITLRDARHGYGAQESFVNATRFVFACAVKAGHLRESPATGLSRPRRRRSPRRALSADELRMVLDAVLATSRDPELDMLILAFARETACRREGILNLRSSDLQPTPSVILYEKFEEQREIPISLPLLAALRRHADQRAPACQRVFHYLNGRCLTDRRFDTIFSRVGEHLPWARTLGVSLHWIRYSTLTDIRMTSGERVAAAYAGHGDSSAGVTGIYTRATFAELQAAHRRLFGEVA